MSKPKSKGHVCFWADREVVEIKDELYIGLMSDGFDPDGYRLGLTQHGTKGETRESWLRDCQRLIDSAADGEYYEMHVHPEDNGVFRRPNPDPTFLRFYRFCKDAFKVYPEVRGDIVRVWSYTTSVQPMLDLLGDIATTTAHFKGEFSQATFPLERLPEAIDILEGQYACG